MESEHSSVQVQCRQSAVSSSAVFPFPDNQMEIDLMTMNSELTPEFLAAVNDSQQQNYFAIETTGTLDCMAMSIRWWIHNFGCMIWENGRYYINSPAYKFMGCDIMFRIFKESTFKNNFVLICSDPQRLQNVEISLKHKGMNGQIFKWIKCTEFHNEKNFRNLITTKNLLDSFEKTGSSDLLVECEFVIRTARDNIYVLGGVESNNKCASDKVEVINIIGNIISTMCTRMPVPIAGCTSILVPEKDDYTYTEDSSDTLSTFSERLNYKTGVEDYYSGESSKTSSTLEDVYYVNRDIYLPPMSPVNRETFPKKKEKIKIPVTRESSSERKNFKTGVDGYYSGESFKTSSMLEDVNDVNSDKYLPPMSPINKETFSKENEKIDIPVTQESSTVSERKKLKTGVEDYYSGESPKTSSTSEDVYDVNRDKYLPSISPVNKETFPKETGKIEIPITKKSSAASEKNKIKTDVEDCYSGESSKTSSTSEDVYDVNRDKYLPSMSSVNKETFPKENRKIEIPIIKKSSTASEKNKIKTGIEDHYSGESSKTSSTSEDVYDVNRDKYLPSMSSVNKETFLKKNEKIEIPVAQESSAVSEKNKIKTGVEDYYSDESSKTSSILENACDVNRAKYLPSMSSINKEPFIKKNEKNEIPVTQKSSTFSERKNVKTGVEDYYSPESSKTSSTLEDVYNVNRNIHLSSISAVNQLHSESFKETFSKKIKNIETPVIIESFKKKGLFTSKVNELKTNRNKEIRYRTSMDIFLDSGEFGLYASKREPSQASKWLNYKKFSLSDEKLHKEVFQSKSPELHVKTEVVNTEVNLKSPKVKKHFVKDRNLDLSSSIRVRSSLSSQHKSFMYAKSNVKEKLPDINVYQNNENRRKATSQDTVLSEIIDLKLKKVRPEVKLELLQTIRTVLKSSNDVIRT